MVSLRDLAIDNVVTTLDAVPVFAAGGGAQKNDSRRPEDGGNKFGDLPMVVVEMTGETKQPIPTGRYTCELALELIMFAQRDPAVVDTRSDDEVLSELITEIEKALRVAPQRATAGVVDTVLQSFEVMGAGTDDVMGAIYNVMVRYQHDDDDPESFS